MTRAGRRDFPFGYTKGNPALVLDARGVRGFGEVDRYPSGKLPPGAHPRADAEGGGIPGTKDLRQGRQDAFRFER